MTLRLSISGIAASMLLACVAPMRAQQLIGYVNTKDAEVTGAADVLNGQAVLTGSAGITARDHTAPVLLGRGGTVRVCQTSVVHITESKSAEVSAPLLFSLERGAVEIQMTSSLNDAIMTPDLRFTIVNRGPLDLRLRVARNGDTCVENRGQYAPTLNISDPFGETMYQVSAGQHVLFEHGSLREVVDQEKSACGCPAQQGMSMADALLASGGTKTVVAPPVQTAPAPTPVVTAPVAPVVIAAAPVPAPVKAAPPAPAQDTQADLQRAEQAAAQAAMRAAEQKHPFPEAISEGLAPPAEVAQAAPGAPHAQVTDSLSYNAPTPTVVAAPSTTAAAKRGKKAAKAAAAAQPAKTDATPAQPAPAKSNDLVHLVGRFFKRLFGH